MTLDASAPGITTSPPQPKDIDPRVRDALWSLYFHARQLSPGFVPPELRPAPLGPAIISMLDVIDNHSAIRAYNSVVQLFYAARTTPSQIFLELPLWLASQKRIEIQDILDPASSKLKDHVRANDVPIDMSAIDYLFDWLRKALRGHTDNKPCAYPSAVGTYNAITKQITVSSDIIVTKPLDDALADLLDPQRWDECSDLFKLTYRVHDVGGFDYPIGPGQSEDTRCGWDGLMYEMGGVGPQTVENILHISYCVDRDPKDHSKINWVTTKYRLHASLSYQVGGLSLPGMMRENWGVLRADPIHFKVEDVCFEFTKVHCDKTLNFARLTRWSGGSLFDYGEILNYIAPAVFCLWVDDLQQIVPCCKQLPPPHQARERTRR